MIFRNFVRYKPDNASVSAIYLRSENGEDWYDIRGSLDTDAFKIVYNATGVIFSGSFDATGLFPENASIAEIDRGDIPDGFAIDGNWVFDGEQISRRERTAAEKLELAEWEKKHRLSEVSIVIDTLQDAVDYGIATDDEKTALSAWKKYRVLLMRVDTAAPVWPMPPEV